MPIFIFLLPKTSLLTQAVFSPCSMNKVKIIIFVFCSQQIKRKHVSSCRYKAFSAAAIPSATTLILMTHWPHNSRQALPTSMIWTQKGTEKLAQVVRAFAQRLLYAKAKGWTKPNRGTRLCRPLHFNFINYSIWQATWRHMTGRRNIHALLHVEIHRSSVYSQWTRTLPSVTGTLSAGSDTPYCQLEATFLVALSSYLKQHIYCSAVSSISGQTLTESLCVTQTHTHTHTHTHFTST